MIKLLDAIFAIDPKAEVTFHEENIDSLKWDSTPIPKDIILAKQAEMQTAYDNNKYQRDRAEDYATLQDQADMQYWDAVNGTTLWQEHIAEIKAKHPKG